CLSAVQQCKKFPPAQHKLAWVQQQIDSSIAAYHIMRVSNTCRILLGYNIGQLVVQHLVVRRFCRRTEYLYPDDFRLSSCLGLGAGTTTSTVWYICREHTNTSDFNSGRG
ncbi:unnamed protein product, partial [Pylaiella littoralis]